MRRLIRALVPVLCLAGFLTAATSHAGTQDFTLVNKTGDTIYSLYIGESTSQDWEEDVLGEDTLENGARMNITFSGRKACNWDIYISDPDGGEATWTDIDLCEVSVVVLHCKQDECWAEFE